MECRRACVGAIAVLACVPFAFSCSDLDVDSPGDEPGRPTRIVLVSMDTVRADRVSGYGEADTTPNLARIAREGVLFDRFYAASSYTIPSHMSIFTGLDPLEHGVTTDGARLAPKVPTLAERLREAGYRTQAFHESGYVDARFGFGRGFDAYQPLQRLAVVGYSLPRVTRWMREQGDAPYFLFVHTYAAHFPFGGFDAYRASSPARGLPVDAEIDSLRKRWPGFPSETAREERDVPEDIHSLCTLYNQLAESNDRLLACGSYGTAASFPVGAHFEEDLAAIRKAYDERIHLVDDMIGQLRTQLESLGQWEDTLLVVTSDHGEAFFEHGHYKHGYVPFEEVLRVPLIWSWPRGLGASERIVGGLAWHLDLFPTIAGLANVPTPGDLRGLDLSAVLRGQAELPQDRAVLPAVLRSANREPRPLRRAVLQGRWKLIEGQPEFGDSRGLLFDLLEDPLEEQNLREDDAETLARLEAIARQWSQGLRPIPAVNQKSGVSLDQAEQLRALGYAR